MAAGTDHVDQPVLGDAVGDRGAGPQDCRSLLVANSREELGDQLEVGGVDRRWHAIASCQGVGRGRSTGDAAGAFLASATTASTRRSPSPGCRTLAFGS